MMIIMVSIRQVSIFSHMAIWHTIWFAVSDRRLGDLRMLWLSQISIVEEFEKQQKVREVHNKGPCDVLLANMTFSTVLLLIPGDTVDVDADDHLKDLTTRDGDVHPFGDLEAEGAQCVVRVHDWVNGVVHDREPATGGGEVASWEPAVDEHGGVVVPVQEDELLFAQHDEDRVAQFRQFAHDEKPLN